MIADVHLGKLARLLRMLGFDTVYNNTYTISELTTIALVQKRVLLSRNTAIAKNKSISSFILLSEEPHEQLKQVMQNFPLKSIAAPFTRCLVCNGEVKMVKKEAIMRYLEQNTITYYNEFWQCTDCQQIYWKGSHYERMKSWITKTEQNQ